MLMVYARASLERIQIKGTRQILILTVNKHDHDIFERFLVYDIYLINLYCLRVFSLVYKKGHYYKLLDFYL